MIQSQFISNILDLLLDGDKEGIAIRPQLPYLSDDEYNYTGPGLFVTFRPEEGIMKYKHAKDRVILDGVSITSPEIDAVGAFAILYTKDGIVDILEICAYIGEYPRKELSSYLLKQDGSHGMGREIMQNG